MPDTAPGQPPRRAAVGPALVQQAQRGDAAAFAALYRQTVDAVARYVSAILAGRAPVDDAVAETYLQAWRELPRLRHPERFEAWLFRLARHRAIDAVRRPPTVPLAAVPEPPTDPRTSPEAVLLARDDQDQLHRAIAALPPDQHTVVVLFYLRGLTHAEIGAQLGRSAAASRALLHRALAQLRDLLAGPATTRDAARAGPRPAPPPAHRNAWEAP